MRNEGGDNAFDTKEIHTSLMVAVGQNEENILKNGDVELTEENACSLYVSFGHVVHQFQAHGETRVLDLSVVMLRCPHAGINDKLELRAIKLE